MLRQPVFSALLAVILLGTAAAPAADPQKGPDSLLDRGRLQRTLAGQFEGPARQDHLEAARGLLRQADQGWAEIDKAADEELKHIVFVRGEDIKRSEARDQIYRRQLQARLGRAWAQYELAQTWPAGSGERTAGLQEAANRFDAIYDQQRERLAGFYARLGRGLCCRDLGESEKAFAIFEELLALPDEPADFHTLRGKAAVQALETALRPEVKKYKQGLDIAQRWTGDDRPQAAPSEAPPVCGEIDLAIRFLGGEAALAYSKSLPAAAIRRDEPGQSASDAPAYKKSRPAAALEPSALRTLPIDWARRQFHLVSAAPGHISRARNSVCSIRP